MKKIIEVNFCLSQILYKIIERETAMILENKLGITDSVELAKAEEKISKKRAIELFESGYLNHRMTITCATSSLNQCSP